MSLRFKLLLVALSTLALPWAGWQFVRQAESLMRQGQEQALLAAAGMLAKALEARRVELPPAGPVLYVQRADEPIIVDGYADDWSALRPYAQALGPRGDPQKLRVLLARQGGDLYLLAEVRDATRARADARDPRVSISDYVDLGLTQDGETRRYRLASAAPGGFDAPADGGGGALPDHLAGAWQEDGSGYRIELKLPRGVRPQRIGLVVHDSAVAGGDAAEARSLLDYDEDAARALRPLVPEHARARLIAADGWLLADAGRLDAPASLRGEKVSAFAGWVYRNLIAPTLGGSRELDGDAPRIDAAEVWQALSGVPATSWRSASTDVVVLTAAVPLGGADGTRGALVLEQATRALPQAVDRAVSALSSIAFAVAALFIIVTAFGIGILVARIRRLRAAVERLAKPDSRIDSQSLPLLEDRDELGDLARSFRKLLDEVAAYTDYLRTLASKLSHELNTPLAIVKSSLDNLEHQALPADARSYLSRARDGADRLGAIVRAMSEANRIERAIAAAEAEDFDLRAVVAGCAESYRALAAPRALRLQLPSTPAPFHGAPELIAQALDKLFDNACSFTPADGWIALSLSRSEDGATTTIRLANSGPLLPATMQERLFDSLVSVRERASRAGEAPHLGLGLYVVRLVAELHRGSAAAGNLADGGGVEFSLIMQGMPRRRLSEGGSDA
ncbi:ATP-binding protein [Dokdonella sp.]|uniref:ATP-binding protein n=1 Tax=Dokdonella sp. TaxID=2291710 RepID=UPI001B1041AE|nr:ATP-binding protein [Dokdonella sp.]MBO9664404.1 HAMP domain-containing protein [Dokdonella sp.]